MNTNEIEAVANKITQLVSSGVEAAKPLAIETIHQYQTLHLVQSCLGLLPTIIGVIIFNFLRKSNDSDTRGIGVVLMIIGFIISITLIFKYIGGCIAPLPSLLKLL